MGRTEITTDADVEAATRLLDECRGKLEVAEGQIENLGVALVSVRRIGAAVGIIMASRRVTDDAAFEVLASASNRRNMKVRDLAEEVILTGVIPE